jgi:hypothetical protein
MDRHRTASICLLILPVKPSRGSPVRAMIETKKAKTPNRYVCRFRGNTLMDIFPRNEGPDYALYQRDAMQGTNAPMKSIERYFAPALPRW